MKALLLAFAMVAGFATQSFAGELDNDAAVANQQIAGTVVIRVDSRTKEVAALHTNSVMKNEVQAKALTSEKFEAVSADKVRSELDKDGGASSWYFYYGYNYNYGYNYGYMNWYGNWYQPCYNYNYNYYSYYYYSNSWSWNRW